MSGIDFLTEYEQLAAELAKQAREAATSLADRIDALKALTPFYVHKTKGKKGEEPSDGFPDFDSFQASIHATETTNGTEESGVRGRRRNGN